ncbi:MAG: hypothetical protein GX763_09395 [Clostridiaceae bacterium]|nr:hypothetical protein [Clostridiaceae bacterium]
MFDYQGDVSVVISVPEGERIAKKTFNSSLGILGGISIIGTTGIVEPMSEKAVVDTFKAELSLLYEAGHRDVVLTIGNYGERFAREMLGLPLESHVKCSNFIGETLSAAAEKGFLKARLIGHIGKLIKLGIGITNTHSSHGDGRMETLITCALEAGASLFLLNKIRESVSTDAALIYLRKAELMDSTMLILKNRVEDTLVRHVAGKLSVSLVCFEGMGSEMKELFRI